MNAWRAAFVAFAIAAPITVVTVMAGCDQGSPASPTLPPIPEASVVICPDLDPSFDSIRTKLLNTDSCGADRGGQCHSAGGGIYSGGLDYTADASALYVEFLGDAGIGARAQNINGSEQGLRRVVPGEEDASFLYIKVTTVSSHDPKYGTGMPFDHPGALCPAAVGAIGTWIQNGAPFEEDASASEDASSDADASDLDAGDAGD